MSNVKSVHISADVPFNYLTELNLTDVATIAIAVMTPSGGLQHSYARLPSVPNEHGGKTAMYRLIITGEEALSWAYLDNLRKILASVGTIVSWDVVDIEA